MRFTIRFRIHNRWGTGSVYSLRDLCVSVVDRYSLSERDLCQIVTLTIGETFSNENLLVKRID